MAEAERRAASQALGEQPGLAAALQRRQLFVERQQAIVGRRRQEVAQQLLRQEQAQALVRTERAALRAAQTELEVAQKAAERWDERRLREEERRAELELEELSARLPR